ncbi:MAG: hypothetical protein JWR66_2681, partial [Modestobacter sp.]|nr:hypothetical protein [Modestobacter sp.]
PKDPATSLGRPKAACWAGCGGDAGGVLGCSRTSVGANAPVVPAGRP